ncbi:hypothetical protein [Haloglomus halophilum]|uniref:hypothetical protein n=1 Tax=Haloglomus halophilum TaxID=2962672 RepID=UPI0020C95654|nr:hypothetical protein [Haloglomus halophilum]
MTAAVSTFWRECNRYHDLAKTFLRNVERSHPRTLSGRHPGCPSDNYCCGYCATGITYYEYRGPSV